jgi:hypothetical protein
MLLLLLLLLLLVRVLGWGWRLLGRLLRGRMLPRGRGWVLWLRRRLRLVLWRRLGWRVL